MEKSIIELYTFSLEELLNNSTLIEQIINDFLNYDRPEINKISIWFINKLNSDLLCKFASKNKKSSYLLQYIIKNTTRPYYDILCSYFHNNIIKLLYHKFGNFVIRVLIESMPIDFVQFLINEINILYVAKNQKGCRIIIAFIIHGCNTNDNFIILMNTIKDNCIDLVNSMYGKYIIIYLIKDDEHKQIFIQILFNNFEKLSISKNGCFVIKNLLEVLSDNSLITLLMNIQSNNDMLNNLISNRYGRLILKKILLTYKSVFIIYNLQKNIIDLININYNQKYEHFNKCILQYNNPYFK